MTRGLLRLARRVTKYKARLYLSAKTNPTKPKKENKNELVE